MSENIVNVLKNVTPDEVYATIARSILSQAFSGDEEMERWIEQLEEVAIPVAGDTFYFLYAFMPLLRGDDEIPNPVLRGFAGFLRQLGDSSEYTVLRRITRLDRDASLVYAIRFSKAFLSQLKEKLPRNIGSGGCKGGGKCGGDAQNIVDIAMRAARRAHEEARRAALLYQALGQGFEPAELAFLDEKIRINTVELESFINVLVKLRKTMPLMFHHSKRRGRLEMPGGYQLTSRIERALPRELAMPDDVLELKMITGNLLSKERIEKEKSILIILLDSSGSMQGTKMGWAKAVAYALSLKSLREKMDFIVVPFNVKPLAHLGREDLEKLLRIRANGGTNITEAISEAFRIIRESRYTKSNIVVITDGEDEVIHRYANKISQAAAEHHARIQVVYIEGRNKALEEIARATGGALYSVKPTSEDALKLVSLVG